MATMADELKETTVSGATIHCTPEEPLPRELGLRIVQERLKEVGLA